MSPVRIGTAGWSIPRAAAEGFPGDGSHLARYARVLLCAEINSSFHRSHRPEVYARWAAQAPAGFRFAVKLPRTITHDQRLRASRPLLTRFIAEVSGLGDRLGVLLVQLPPSLPFEPRPVRTFFELLASMSSAAVVCEPRHATWFEPAADRWLVKLQVARVAADPAGWPAAAVPGGWLGPAGDGAGAVVYHRWHGSPRMYYSAYSDDWLQARAQELERWPAAAERWCIFDNTASGAAAADALRLRAWLSMEREISDAAIEDMILGLLASRREGSTLCPSEVARALAPDDGPWRQRMPQVRRAAQRLAESNRLSVTRGGVQVDAMSPGGPIRLGLPTATPASAPRSSPSPTSRSSR